MRIGLFTDAYFPIISGVSISVRTLAQELRKLGHEVYIMSNDHERAEAEEYVLRLGGYRLPMKGMGEYRVGKVTRKKIKEIIDLNLDIIHCHTEFTMGRLGRKAARKSNLPVVHTYHTMYEDYVHFISKTLMVPLRFASKWYSKSFANSANEVIFPTVKVKRTFDRYRYKKAGHIIPTGIYLDKFRKINYKNQDLQTLRASLGFSEEDIVLLFLGRLSREKSIADLLQEFAKIPYKNVKLLMVGGGPDKEMFETIVRTHGIQDRVVFTGMVPPSDVGNYYHISDLFVNFSVTETQGLTYIEALSCGCPLLVKYDDNLEDVVTEGHNGYTFRKNEEFVSLFDTLYKNKILLQKISKNAASSVEKFSAQNYAKQVEDIYKKVLKG